MQYETIKITFPNGRIKLYSYSSFDFYASTNELEHKEENIIIMLNNLSLSFVYEIDVLSGEISNKENVSVELLQQALRSTDM